MDHSTPENNQPAVSEAPVDSAASEAIAELFRLSFVIPGFQFKASNGARLKRQVRAVMRQALVETKQEIQNIPVGMRVHVQLSLSDLSEEQKAAARAGRKLPGAKVTEVGNLLIDAANGILITDPTKVVQYVCTVAWGENDAIQVSTWEIDLGRREGVQ